MTIGSFFCRIPVGFLLLTSLVPSAVLSCPIGLKEVAVKTKGAQKVQIIELVRTPLPLDPHGTSEILKYELVLI